MATRENYKEQYKLAKSNVEPLIDRIFNDFKNRTCGSCSVINCEILNAIANTGTIRLVDFGCNKWEDINAN